MSWNRDLIEEMQKVLLNIDWRRFYSALSALWRRKTYEEMGLNEFGRLFLCVKYVQVLQLLFCRLPDKQLIYLQYGTKRIVWNGSYWVSM